MKNQLTLVLILIILSVNLFAQSPNSFKYQAVIRDVSGNIIAGQSVGMQMTIIQGSPTGTTVYQETFSPTTNSYGLVNLEIGTGIVTTGNFFTINWGVGPFFIETALDPTGGISYVVMGTSQLLSVPYALHAATAENVINDNVDDADADATNEYNATVVLNGTDLETTDGGGTIYTDLSTLQDGVGTDNQTLTLNNDTLSIEGGNNVYLGGSANDSDWVYTPGIVYNNSDKIGIGTASPSTWLNINNTYPTVYPFGQAHIAGSPHAYLTLEGIGSTSASGIHLLQDSYRMWSISNDGTNGDMLHFWNPNGNKMSITQAGDVGIGTTSPLQKLDVAGKVKSQNTRLMVETAGGYGLGLTPDTIPGLVLNFTTGNLPVMIMANLSALESGLFAGGHADLIVDGVIKDSGEVKFLDANGGGGGITLMAMEVLAPGPHTVIVQGYSMVNTIFTNTKGRIIVWE